MCNFLVKIISVDIYFFQTFRLKGIYEIKGELKNEVENEGSIKKLFLKKT